MFHEIKDSLGALNIASTIMMRITMPYPKWRGRIFIGYRWLFLTSRMRGLLMAVGFFYSCSVIADDEMKLKTLYWAVTDLHSALNSPVDMNRLASLTFPIAHAWDRGLKTETEDVLDKVSTYIRTVEIGDFECGERVDIYLTIEFLARTGRNVRRLPLQKALEKCNWGNSRFDLANTLFLFVAIPRKTRNTVFRERLIIFSERSVETVPFWLRMEGLGSI